MINRENKELKAWHKPVLVKLDFNKTLGGRTVKFEAGNGHRAPS